MSETNESKTGFGRFVEMTDHPWFNIAFLGWGLFTAVALATIRDDVYLIAKAGEIVALALGRLLIQRQARWFFGGLLATAIALPIAVYTTTPIFWGRFLPLFSGEFFETVLLGGLCAIPILIIAIWGLNKASTDPMPPKPDPKWVKSLNHLFKWALTGMVLSFHLANPALIIGGILIFLTGMICLATVRLRLTLRHVGNFLLIIGIGTVVIALLLIPLGIAHVSGAEAAMAVVPGIGLAVLGFFLRLGSVKRAG